MIIELHSSLLVELWLEMELERLWKVGREKLSWERMVAGS
jgi:hypothetical protein